MDNNSEGSPKDQDFETPKLELKPQREPFFKRMQNAARSTIGTIVETVVPFDKKIPLDEIDQSVVANTLLGVNYNILRERRGEDPRSPFTIVDVMSELGYRTPSITADYKEKFPKEYSKLRQILNTLAHEGILEAKQQPDDPHRENVIYRIQDLDQLTDLSIQKPQELTT